MTSTPSLARFSYMRIIVSGSRQELTQDEGDLVMASICNEVCRFPGRVGIGVGCCPTGVDALVREDLCVAAVFEADWDRLGNAAGPERNQRMVDWAAEEGGSVLLAFPRPHSVGTWSTIRKAVKAGLRVVIVPLGD